MAVSKAVVVTLLSLLTRFVVRTHGLRAGSMPGVLVSEIVFLGESVTLRLVLASVAILTGIALVILGKQNAGT